MGLSSAAIDCKIALQSYLVPINLFRKHGVLTCFHFDQAAFSSLTFGANTFIQQIIHLFIHFQVRRSFLRFENEFTS